MRNLIAFSISIFVLIFSFGFLLSSLMEMSILEIELARDVPYQISLAHQAVPEKPEPVAMPENGWHGVFDVPTLFSSEELEEIIPNAPHYTYTRPVTPHPERAMTEFERGLWIESYNRFGGINAQEFELYKIVNEIRERHGLPPFILCPRLSRASRMFSHLQVKYYSTGHTDPYYPDLISRADFFGGFGTVYMENANSQMWYTAPDGEITYVYLSPQGLVDGWMDSDAHREHILTLQTTHVGFGVDSGDNRVVPTMKSIMPRN